MWSQAKDFDIHGGSFTDVSRDYHQTTYLQFINLNGVTTDQVSSVLDGSFNDTLDYNQHVELPKEMDVVEVQGNGSRSAQCTTAHVRTGVELFSGQESNYQSACSGSRAMQTETQPLRRSLAEAPAVLDDAVRLRGEKLNWRESIVDLMKVLNIDSTYGARKQLAARWRYGGDMGDSRSMNLWLHRRIMQLLEGSNGNLDTVRNIIRAVEK